jgi:murein DD-endopeptidase MepM/ murein hydrolase activator NlpD/GH24 family phage-related lysozyme (muramidase)
VKYLKVYNKFQNDRRLFEAEQKLDDPAKADLVDKDVLEFYKNLEDAAKVPEGLKQQPEGGYTYQKTVETMQIGLSLLGYELPRFGVDGKYGSETADAVKKFKEENSEDQTNTTMWSRLKKWVGSIFEEENLEVSGDYVKIDNNFLSETTLSYPLKDFKLTWPFGPRWGRQHNGIDLAVNSGTPILSPLEGKVLVAEFRPDSCGGTIIINHEPDLQTIYCHCSEIIVKRGDDVKKGQTIGKTGGGSSDKGRGNSIGPHLHFGLIKGGQHVDPELYLDKEIGAMTGTQITPGHSHHTHETPDETEVDNIDPGTVMEPVYLIRMLTLLKDKNINADDIKRFIDPRINTSGGINISLEGTWLDIAFEYIASKESFSPTAKWDENKYRGGYGTDKIMKNGQLQDADKNTIWTKEEAEATLKHQIEQFAGIIAGQLGKEHWEKLNDRQKAALLSLGYNAGPYFVNSKDYGKRIKQAIINDDFVTAANEIANGPKSGIQSGYLTGLAKRRAEESQLFLA